MAEHLDEAVLRDVLADGEQFASRAFEILRSIASRIADEAFDEAASRDLVIRALEHRDRRADLEPVFSSLAAQVGLYPYADPVALGESQLLAFEAQRPFGAASDYVFHQEQGHVYRSLLDGENVILSASTSFGKSLVIDALLASRDFTNCAVVVPTIALLDETRRRLSRYRDYKVITHTSQR